MENKTEAPAKGFVIEKDKLPLAAHVSFVDETVKVKLSIWLNELV